MIVHFYSRWSISEIIKQTRLVCIQNREFRLFSLTKYSPKLEKYMYSSLNILIHQISKKL